MTRSFPRIRWVALALVAPIATAAGCNYIGPAIFLIHGPTKTPAQYELDPERPTVVFVDDLSNRVPKRSLRLVIAQEAEKALLSEGALTDVIQAKDAMAAATADRYDKPMPVTEIGRSVKADVVIYASVEEFTLSADRQTFLPYARLRVKVIDAKDDTRLWPKEGDGYIIQVRANVKQGSAPTTLSAQSTVEDELAHMAGLDVARLFFKHEAQRSPQSLD